jgi:hypothetical protein
MEYFCYISRSKVDQLYQALAPREPEEWTEQRSTEQKFDVDAKADWNVARIISLFKGGITYGRKGVIHREQKVKLQYVEKLRLVLAAIAKEAPIPALRDAIRSGFPASPYCHHAGEFKIADPVKRASTSDVVTLRTSIEGVRLSLDCSLRFFSEGNTEPDGNSGGIRGKLSRSTSRCWAPPRVANQARQMGECSGEIALTAVTKNSASGNDVDPTLPDHGDAVSGVLASTAKSAGSRRYQYHVL